MLRKQLPEFSGAKSREIVRQHVHELESTAKDFLKLDLKNEFTKSSLFIFSNGIKNYTERKITMHKGRIPKVLTEYWMEELEKLITSMYDDDDLKFELTNLLTILNFLNKIAKEYEYSSYDDLFKKVFEHNVDFTSKLYGIAAEALEEEFEKKVSMIA